jgi:hypothetical protein
VFKEKSTGVIMGTMNNIHPSLKVEVVLVPDGQAVVTADEKCDRALPFFSLPQSPVPRP